MERGIDPWLTKNLVDSMFEIHPDEGKIFWKNVSKHHIGLNRKEAGGPSSARGKTYWVVSIHGKKYKRSRIIFLHVHGNISSQCLDHINGNSLDDRISNLREASFCQNCQNVKEKSKKSGLPMGIRTMASGKYQARISVNGRQIHLGCYETVEEAASVYQKKRKEFFNDFA